MSRAERIAVAIRWTRWLQMGMGLWERFRQIEPIPHTQFVVAIRIGASVRRRRSVQRGGKNMFPFVSRVVLMRVRNKERSTKGFLFIEERKKDG
jgi:hypothetical protein